MNKILSHWAAEGAWALSFGVLIAYGWLLMTIGFHDYAHPQEDSRIVWVCSYHGDGKCGPDSPRVSIDLGRLLN